MFGRNKPQKRLDAARADLAAAEAKADEIARGEGDAIETAASHAAWRRQTEEAANEVDRLKRLIMKIEAEIAEEARQTAAAAQAKLEAEANRKADEAGAAMLKAMGEVERLVRQTLRAIAEADIAVDRANASRSEDLPRLLRTEQRVRSVDRRPKRIISESVVTRWVYSESGNIINRDMVDRITNVNGSHGVIQTTSHTSKVEQRQFRKVVYMPESDLVHFKPLAEALSLPGLMAGDIPVWIPLNHSPPSAVLAKLDDLEASRSSPPEAQTQLQYIPIKDASLQAEAAA